MYHSIPPPTVLFGLRAAGGTASLPFLFSTPEVFMFFCMTCPVSCTYRGCLFIFHVYFQCYFLYFLGGLNERRKKTSPHGVSHETCERTLTDEKCIFYQVFFGVSYPGPRSAERIRLSTPTTLPWWGFNIRCIYLLYRLFLVLFCPT